MTHSISPAKTPAGTADRLPLAMAYAAFALIAAVSFGTLLAHLV